MLQLRQQRLELNHQANRLHNQIEAQQAKLWNQQLQIAVYTAPNAISQTVGEHDLKLVPQSPAARRPVELDDMPQPSTRAVVSSAMPHAPIDDDEDDDDIDPEGPDPSEMDYSDDPDLDVCPHCRKMISEDAEHCPHCGEYISPSDAPLSPAVV